MAKIDDVRHILRHLKVKIGTKKNNAFPIEYQGSKFSLSSQEIDRYLSLKDKLQYPFETALFHDGYYEQSVDIQGRHPINHRLFRTKDAIELSDVSSKRTIKVSGMSTVFGLSLLDKGDVSREILRMIHFAIMPSRHYGKTEPPLFADLFRRILTIKVSTSADDPYATNLKRLQSLAEAGLFHVAYGEGIGICLSQSWERAYYRLGLRRDAGVQFPLRTYNPELLAYYHLAFGSDSLILAYLALYKILEYFFTSSSERLLHEKMRETLIQPDFSHTKEKKLRELTKVIRSHDNKIDERRMLKTVLEHYFDTASFRQWVEDFESTSEKYFTVEREVFAEKLCIDVSDDQLFSTTAARIYHLRNALVHYKEGEVSRFIPFSGQERMLYKEIPLLLYLAEQIIIKTGKDIN